jgi:hypothetical protein
MENNIIESSTWYEKFEWILKELQEYLPNWKELKKSFEKWSIKIEDIRVSIWISYTLFDLYEENKDFIENSVDKKEFYDFFMIFWIITIYSHITLLDKEENFTESILKLYKNICTYQSLFPGISIDFLKSKFWSKIKDSDRKKEVYKYFETTLLFESESYQNYADQIKFIQDLDRETWGSLKIELFSEEYIEYKKLELEWKNLFKIAQNVGVNFYYQLEELQQKFQNYSLLYPTRDVSSMKWILKELTTIKSIKQEVEDILNWERESLTRISEKDWSNAYNYFIAAKITVRNKKWNL